MLKIETTRGLDKVFLLRDETEDSKIYLSPQIEEMVSSEKENTLSY